ncbi:MAG: 50S ribosomal protein L11 methyltransferase [Bacillota bacterium]|nr:50S ribosomal protein L11 methyltransferase [Bacillota bacterium]
MKYIELKVHASRQGIEMVTELFLKNGIDQVSIDDPEDLQDILNKEHEYEWDYIDDKVKARPDREPTISAYFEDSEENKAMIQHLKLEIMMLKGREQYGEYGPDADFGRLYAEDIPVDDADWKDKWKENFKPVKVTDRIVVKPTWEEYEAKAGELILQIDPGMAFGTGTHETTSLCMKLLEKYMGENDAVLDVGCGSGILSIAAALLGSRSVLGIEIDEDAVKVAGENVDLNGVSDSVRVQQGDLTKGIDFKADLIVANLMHHLVMELARDAADHLADGGVFISSGILLEKKEQVENAVREAGFEILEIPEDGEWCAIAARKAEK